MLLPHYPVCISYIKYTVSLEIVAGLILREFSSFELLSSLSTCAVYKANSNSVLVAKI